MNKTGSSSPAMVTRRLELIPLTRNQLQFYLEAPARLETMLGIPISRSIITERVRKAVGMKLAKMEEADETKLIWHTYWIIVIREASFGAGLAGFKGFPNSEGEAEIGYGLDPLYQKRGYMTEAVEKMIQWAFGEKACHSIVAIGVDKSNIASQRVLQKVGMSIYQESGESRSYRILRDQLSKFRN
jgi:[ribosomal protein S5]-alanine N-acetyltransferase